MIENKSNFWKCNSYFIISFAS